MMPEGVAESVRLCVETGVAGLSIEDATGDHEKPLYELPLAVERIQAARAAIDALGADVLLTARAECFLVGHADPLREAVKRLQAYSEAGADVLYAPGPQGREEIETIVKAASPKPVNVLDERENRPESRRSCGDGRAPDQRGIFAGARGVDRVHPARRS